MINPYVINSLVLAYLGDTVYENYIREFLVRKGINNVNDLQNSACYYTSAKGQAKFLEKMINDNFLTSEEIDVCKRARNAKSKSHPKNTDVITYRNATGMEALIGYLKIINNISRIEEIMNYILREGIDNDSIR